MQTEAGFVPFSKRSSLAEWRLFYLIKCQRAVMALLPISWNEKAVTATLYHELLQRTEAQPFLGVCVRAENGFRMRYTPIEGKINSPDPLTSCNALNRAIETEIRRVPQSVSMGIQAVSPS